MLDVFSELIAYALFGVDLLVKVVIVGVVALFLLRWVALRMSPFGWLAYHVRKITDPMLWPITSAMPMGQGASIAPLLVILVTVLTAYFFKWVVTDTLRAMLGLIGGLTDGALVTSLGWVLYGAISVFLALLVMRIVFSWLPFGRDGRVMWRLYALTEPVMAPFRSLIPPLGMLDLSPILLILLLNFVQSAIYGMLIQ